MNKRNNSPLVIHFLSDVFMRFDMKQQNWMCVTFALLFSIFTLCLGPLLCLKRLQTSCLQILFDSHNKKETCRQKYPIFVFYFPLLICSALFNIHRPDATENFCKLLLVAVAIGHFHFLHCFNLPVIKVVKSWDCYKIQHAAILQLHFIWTFDQPWFFSECHWTFDYVSPC